MLMLTLYTTEECHLCELAEGVVTQTLRPGTYELEEVEIADSEELTQRYGLTIPVLALQGAEVELNWPFNDEQLVAWLEKLI